MPAITQNPMDLSGEQTLLGILQRLRDLQAQPMVPNNPMAQLGTVLQGFASGTQGRANPALEMYGGMRQQALKGLGEEAQIGGALSTLQNQRAQREADRQRLLSGMAGDVMRALPDNPGAIKIALKQYRDLGLVTMDDAAIETVANAGMAKSLQDRLKLAAGALDAGADPTTLGINLPPTSLEALKTMTPDQRVSLFGPDAKKTFLANREAEVKLKTDRLVGDATERIALGTATAADYRLTGKGAKSPDAVIGELLGDFYSGRPLTPQAQDAIKQYLDTKRLQGLTGDAQLAMRAATGDKTARRALEVMKETDRNLTEVELYLRAGKIQATLAAQPGLTPTIDEQATLNAANLMAERRDAKPLPETAGKRFSSMRVILGQVNIIEDLLKGGAGKFLGPVKGPVGKMQEKLGVAPDPQRQQLHTALSILLAEVGPEKFGGQFTLPEQALIRDFLAAANAPEQFFRSKLAAVKDMMVKKYRGDLALAKSNKYRVPDEFQLLPGEEAPPKPNDDFYTKYRDLRLQGLSPEDAKRRLRGTP